MTERKYGLLIKSELSQGTRYVSAELMSREDGKDHPLGCSGSYYDLPKRFEKFTLDGLGLYGFVSDLNDHSFIGCEAEFRLVYAIDETKARRMAATLKKVNATIDASKAYEPGDKFLALAKALKLEFVVERVGARANGSSFSDRDWRFMSIEEGRNRYRALIEQSVQEAKGAAA